MTTSLDSKLKKIQGLLAKAYNNTNENEAQAALLLAQKMMIKWGIEEKDVNKKTTKQEKIAQEIYETQTIRAEWKIVLAKLIADNFKCKFFLYGDGGRAYIAFLGLASDAKIAKDIYAKTLDYIIKGRDRCYIKLRKTKTVAQCKGCKGDYSKGFLAGLKDAFKNQVDEQGWGLVIVAAPEVQKAYDSLSWSDKPTKIQTAKTQHIKEAAEMGYIDGKSQLESKKKKKLTAAQ